MPKSPPPPSLSVPPGGDALRAALAGAPTGAILRLAAGEHRGPFVIGGDIELQARDAARPPELIGAGQGALLAIDGRGARVRLIGLTLRDGGDTNSGGLLRVANGAWLEIEDCQLLQGVASGHGGGALYLRRGAATLRGCRIEGCHGRSGGGVLVSNDATLLVERCVFAGNRADHGGAAVTARDRAKVTLRSCDLADHAAPDRVEADLGWLIDAHLAHEAPAVQLLECKLPSRREGALRLH